MSLYDWTREPIPMWRRQLEPGHYVHIDQRPIRRYGPWTVALAAAYGVLVGVLLGVAV